MRTSHRVWPTRTWLSAPVVGTGLSDDEIGATLVMSPATAKSRASRTMIELGASDRAQPVAFAYGAGSVRPGWTS